MSRIHSDRKWRRIARARRREQPYCVPCMALGKSTLATETHHLERVGHSKERLYRGKTINVCGPCHARLTSLERAGEAPPRAPVPPRTDLAGVPTADWAAERARRKGVRRKIVQRQSDRRLGGAV